MRDIGVDLVLEMMSCVPSGTIDPVKWWKRAKSALVVACDYPEWDKIMTRLCSALQIPLPTIAGSQALLDIERRIEALGPGGLDRFRFHVQSVATAVVARASARREEERDEEERTGRTTREVRDARLRRAHL